MSRSTTIWRTAGLLAAVGVALAACGTTGGGTEGEGTDDGEGGGDCVGVIAYVGPLTGPAANLGINIVNGSNLALEQFQEANPDCDITLEEFDSQGDPAAASPLVSEIVGNADIIGVVGPTFSGETAATGAVFAEAGLVTVSPSATNPDLALNGWDTFHRIIGNDATQAPAVAAYLTGTANAEGVFVVDDSSEYGAGLGAGVVESLGDLVVGTESIQVGQTDMGPVVTAVNASGADSLYFAGYYAEASVLVNQLRSGGWEGLFMSGDGTLDPAFVEAAGGAAEGAVLTCPCAPADEEFATAYEASAGQAPGTYSTEGFDAMNILLQGILDGNTDRPSLLEWVNNYDAEGITKHITFDETGEVAEVVVYQYPVEGGEIQQGVPIEQ
ncbi:branched-chain amino acid ABC transporter substrate-binding protein [Occultella kanbiaonis]|uniref:branched-chain amino acid ABC transporter substrate-binding protein n=1 Tax=Occultella kanbiaonis TaxID=2675754 RepID=UPI0012B9406A|nr:branched-chain amino acid ABC transporter substrate-binding protein [Occultella kanbiaonis]